MSTKNRRRGNNREVLPRSSGLRRLLSAPDYRAISFWVIIVAVVGIVGYDLLPAFADEAPNDTVSEVLRDMTVHIPALAWAFGMLGGHFFLRFPFSRSNPALLGAIALGLLLAPLWVTFSTWTWPALFLSGFVLGGYAWPLAPPSSS